MTVATPAKKMAVIATSTERLRKELAKYAGSMTEMQHGANSATTPATKAAKADPPKKRPVSITLLRPKIVEHGRSG